MLTMQILFGLEICAWVRAQDARLTPQDRAFVSAEKYKEGKFILEITLLDDVV